jgi:hypothetical protein
VEVNYEEDVYDDQEEVNNNNKKGAKTNGTTTKVPNGTSSSKSSGGLFASFKSLVGNKILTKESIEPVMEKMQEHLVCKIQIRKNNKK